MDGIVLSAGNRIPQELLGWRHDLAQEAFERLQDRFVSFAISGEARTRPGIPIWEFAKKFNGGKPFDALRQATGDCVSWGVSQAGMYMSAFEIAMAGQEENYHPWFPPYIYAQSRCKPDTGNGRLGRDAGSTGAWGATAVMRYGVLFTDDRGVPAYSGSLADSWGYRGAPKEFEDLARDNPVRSAAKLEAVDQVREALINYKPVTFACMWNFGTGAVSYKGYRTLQTENTVGGHQVCLLHWMDEPFAAAFMLNSWGTKVHLGPDNGEPAGGAWLRAEDLQRHMRSPNCELYGLSAFDGFPAPPNYSPL